MINKICKYITTLGPIGYMPAPGTMATAFTLPFAYFLSQNVSTNYYVLIITGITILSWLIVHYALPAFNFFPDPPAIVIDEVVGTLVTFVGISMSSKTIALGFLLFRFFDITKIGFRYVEKLPGATGIILDDVVAGIFACVFLHLL